MEAEEAREIKKKIRLFTNDGHKNRERIKNAIRIQDEARKKSSGINLSKVVREWRDMR